MKYTFGKRIKELRKAAGETQTTLAEYLGVTQAAICALEGGQFNASRYTAQIANRYKANALWLATGDGNKDASSINSDQEQMTRMYLSLDDDKRKILLALVKSMTDNSSQ